MTNEIIEKMKSQPKKVKAVIREYNSGKYGKMGEYTAIICPHYFKNGDYKHRSFDVIQVLEVTKKGYGYGGCNHSETICDILEVIE